jgi:hypothetical protein
MASPKALNVLEHNDQMPANVIQFVGAAAGDF